MGNAVFIMEKTEPPPVKVANLPALRTSGWNDRDFTSKGTNGSVMNISAVGASDYLELAASSDWAFGTAAFSIEFWFLKPNQILNYVYDTVHNDSVKIIPSFLDYVVSIPFDYWNPRLSLLLGVLIWILCYVFFTRLLLILN